MITIASIQSARTEKEKREAKLTAIFAESFNKIYRKHFGMRDKVIIDIYDKLKSVYKYINISYAQLEGCFRVDINPNLADEDKLVISQNGKRAAIKLYLIQHHQSPLDTSRAYQQQAQLFHVFLYQHVFKDKDNQFHATNYPEAPAKWHVYRCSVCAKAMLAYAKKIPNRLIANKKTVWHKKNYYNDSEEPHQGNYAYAGRVLLKNWELQGVVHNMNIIINKHKGGNDTKPRHYLKGGF